MRVSESRFLGVPVIVLAERLLLNTAIWKRTQAILIQGRDPQSKMNVTS